MALDQLRLQGIIEKGRKDFDLASVSVSVWDSGQELHAAAGLADSGRGLAATPDTYYAIGSSTKAFTAMCLGILADRGLLDLDDPVKKHLPWFRMADKYVEEHLTIRDILCHRCGLPRHDLAWGFTNTGADTRALVESLAYLPPAFKFRYKWWYNNYMFMLGTVLTEEISGQKFDEFVRENIFAPLGMNDSYAYGWQIDDADERKSIPCDKQTPIHREYLTPAAGAGTFYSTTRDMLKWLRFRIHGDEKVLSHKMRIEAQSPQMLMKEEDFADIGMPQVTSSAYGLGWFVYTYRGVTVIHHGGALGGYRSMQMFVPDRDIAVSVLSNCNTSDAVSGIAYALVDMLLGLPAPENWNGLRELYAAAYAADPWAAEAKRLAGSGGAPYTAADYAGVYSDSGYGKLCLEADDKGLFLTAEGTRLYFVCTEGDRFFLPLEGTGYPLHFRRDGSGAVAAVDAFLEPAMPHTPIHFVKA